MRKLVVALFALSFFAIPSAEASTSVIRIVDKQHTNFDGTLRSNELAASLLPNGKLGKLIFGIGSTKRTFVIDAALINEIQDMADGYTFAGKEDVARQQTARNWLFRLRNAVAYNNVVALPYGNPDEKLLKSVAPSELKFYSLYAQTQLQEALQRPDRKSTRLNSSHLGNSYAVVCLKNKSAQVDAIGKNTKYTRHRAV